MEDILYKLKIKVENILNCYIPEKCQVIFLKNKKLSIGFDPKLFTKKL